jgi:ribonuclease HII
MLEFEKAAWDAGHLNVAGIDEAGRGPLAGPVVVAAVSLPPQALAAAASAEFAGLTDSKQLTEKKRELFFARIQQHPSARIGVSIVGVEEIDSVNILKATHAGMRRAVARLLPDVDFILVDGLPVPDLPRPSEAIVEGDGKSLLIAAASVIAKVTRDRIMVELDAKFPLYGFAKHKGYGTADHLAALDRHGPCPAHRKTFAPVRQLKLEL